MKLSMGATSKIYEMQKDALRRRYAVTALDEDDASEVSP